MIHKEKHNHLLSEEVERWVGSNKQITSLQTYLHGKRNFLKDKKELNNKTCKVLIVLVTVILLVNGIRTYGK